jgi:hypothetical protein
MPPADEQPSLLARLRHGIVGLLRRVGVTVAYVFGLARDEQIRLLTEDTARLGSAAVEASTYVEVELRRLQEDVRELREEIAALRRAVDAGGQHEAQLAGRTEPR